MYNGKKRYSLYEMCPEAEHPPTKQRGRYNKCSHKHYIFHKFNWRGNIDPTVDTNLINFLESNTGYILDDLGCSHGSLYPALKAWSVKKK